MDEKYQNSYRLKSVRKFLRLNPTTAEDILWQFLRRKQLGYKFRRQSSVGNYVPDFLCEDLKLVIELDGWTHDSEKTQRRDKIKEEFLKNNCFKVIRFTNEMIYGDIEIILDKIKNVCNERAKEIFLNRQKSDPSPSLPCEGREN